MFVLKITCTWEANATSFQVKFNYKLCKYHIDEVVISRTEYVKIFDVMLDSKLILSTC
jgi:hypothetical protein